MEIKRLFIEGDGFHVPAVLLTPANPTGVAVIVHGYGGNKEEQLGLAWRVAEMGYVTCTIDLRGHGEHMLPFGDGAREDVETAIDYCRRYGKVTVIGHSLGGRLALLSGADAVIALSPALCKTYSTPIYEGIKSLRTYRVQELEVASVFGTLERLPAWEPGNGRRVLIVYGSRDMQDIANACRELKARGVPAIEVPGGLHSDIFLLEPTVEAIKKELAAQE